MKKCGYCGKEYPDDAVVCAVDQQPLPSNAPSSRPPERVPIDMQAHLAARPWQVKLAVGILAAGFAWGFVKIFVQIATQRLSPFRYPVFYFATVFTFVGSGLLLYFVFRGKNWARWLLLGWIIFPFIGPLEDYYRMGWESYFYLVIDIVAVILLFRHPSAQWFTKPKYITENALPAI